MEENGGGGGCFAANFLESPFGDSFTLHKDVHKLDKGINCPDATKLGTEIEIVFSPPHMELEDSDKFRYHHNNIVKAYDNRYFRHYLELLSDAIYRDWNLRPPASQTVVLTTGLSALRNALFMLMMPPYDPSRSVCTIRPKGNERVSENAGLGRKHFPHPRNRVAEKFQEARRL
ncbi:hypothetical protein EVAR_36957_1 [Eumeta japonica]|uniref:Uncharacterized protein n=1 Tax=Eumeta variegata TaxID=151549 RepID=A0A4C1WAH2_EUMVA|nr:hypothetical protein EVAR_36957_1 [Eumeta japonica]